MPDEPATPSKQDSSSAKFTTTRWSVIQNLGAQDPVKSQQAWNELCKSYWYPIYAFARRQGHTPHDAEDLIQSFFCRCIEKGYPEAADQNKGRFRSFLLILFKRYAANEYAKSTAMKRGGGVQIISLEAENKFANEPQSSVSPEVLYDRGWALMVLDQALMHLKQTYIDQGKQQLFDEIESFLTPTTYEEKPNYADVAKSLEMTPDGFKMAVHRARKQYRRLLNETIAETVTSPDEIETERTHLLQALATPI